MNFSVRYFLLAGYYSGNLLYGRSNLLSLLLLAGYKSGGGKGENSDRLHY